MPQLPQAPRAPQAQTATSDTAPAGTTRSFRLPEVSARIELDLQDSDGQDDTDELQRDSAVAEVDLTLLLVQPLLEKSRFVAQMQLSSVRFSEDELNNSDDEFSYDLERLFFDYRPENAFRLRAGRQAIDDPLEALVDEDLDGVRVSYEAGIAKFEVSLTREDLFEASTFDREDDITNTFALIEISPGKNTLWMPYVFFRSAEPLNGVDPDDQNFLNTDESVDAFWAGLQGIVEPKGSAFRYWFHGSVLNGEERDPEGDIDLGGFSVNLGVNWSPELPLDPTFTFAAAHASGGDQSDRFRQTRLQSNDFALNDKTKFRYLGEVVDPELTNIQILTLGVGADLSKDWRADIALHSYRQVELEDNLRGTDIEFSPLGLDDDLGQAADLILAYQRKNKLQIKGTAGVFIPGDAFDDSRDTAWLAKMELQYRFR